MLTSISWEVTGWNVLAFLNLSTFQQQNDANAVLTWIQLALSIYESWEKKHTCGEGNIHWPNSKQIYFDGRRYSWIVFRKEIKGVQKLKSWRGYNSDQLSAGQKGMKPSRGYTPKSPLAFHLLTFSTHGQISECSLTQIVEVIIETVKRACQAGMVASHHESW